VEQREAEQVQIRLQAGGGAVAVAAKAAEKEKEKEKALALEAQAAKAEGGSGRMDLVVATGAAGAAGAAGAGTAGAVDDTPIVTFKDAPRNNPFEEAMVASSGKLVLLDKLLPRLRAEDHRVMITTYYIYRLGCR
jgi:hypothetical protein